MASPAQSLWKRLRLPCSRIPPTSRGVGLILEFSFSLITRCSRAANYNAAAYENANMWERIMFRASAFLSLGLMVLSAGHVSARNLSEQQARAKATAILKGDPYGRTTKIAASRIKKAQLISAGTSACGPVSNPVWQFRVSVPANVTPHGNEPIDGHLVLDARSGRMDCAGLPFLD